MAEVRPEFQLLGRDELLVLCEALALRVFLSPADILRARWDVAVDRTRKAAEARSAAFDEAIDLKHRRGKLTSARLAEEEKADRKLRRLSMAYRVASRRESELWDRLCAERKLDTGGVEL